MYWINIENGTVFKCTLRIGDKYNNSNDQKVLYKKRKLTRGSGKVNVNSQDARSENVRGNAQTEVNLHLQSRSWEIEVTTWRSECGTL